MTKKGLYTGTFNPPTLGHLDIIRRACQICDHLTIGIAQNTEKERALFSLEERKGMLSKLTNELPQCEIVAVSGLVVDFAGQQGKDCIIRGVRAYSDLEQEFSMALANRKLSGIETLFLIGGQETFHIRSSLVREIGRLGHRLHGFVPDEIEEMVFQRLSREINGKG